MTPPAATADQLAAALGALRVSPPAEWEDVRSAYRNGLMAVHPDTTSGTGDEARTADIVEAFRLLRGATQDGAVPLATVLATAAATAAAAVAAASVGPSVATDLSPAVVLESARGDVYARVKDALATEGTISGVDPSAGLIQVVVETPGFAASQLTAEVTPTGDGDAQVLFTLDPLGVGEAPPLEAIVHRLGKLLQITPG